jgi:hypothetical protein
MQHLPELSPRFRIHASGWFIENNKTGSCNMQARGPFFASSRQKAPGLLMLSGSEA